MSHLTFYDHTMHPIAELRVNSNYSLTFSQSRTNMPETFRVLRAGGNVAVVLQHEAQAAVARPGMGIAWWMGTCRTCGFYIRAESWWG
jgi:hypothetical protein